jgi:hypothetical protein
MTTTTVRAAPLLWALFALLSCAYLLGYSGAVESGDSRALFNMTASLYRFGDTLMDLSASEQLPPLPLQNPSAAYPLRSFDIEPLQSLLALPLYGIASITPGIGLVQTTWTFNILVTALTACLVVIFARNLGFEWRSALVVALAFGLCTIALPYSKTFFREPLSALTLLATALVAHRTRLSGYRVGWLGLLAAGLFIMLFTRASSAFALPALLVLLLPTFRGSDGTLPRRRIAAALLVVTVIVIMVFVIGNQIGGRYDFLTRFGSEQTYVLNALHSYLFSIGGSIWGTSPILLLAIPGCVMLWRRGHWRYALALPLLLLSYSTGYALFSNVNWFGGLSWPPRFLVAIVPLLALAVLPVAERAQKSDGNPRGQLVAQWSLLLLCGYGLWIQICAVSVRWGDYLLGLPPEALGTLEWGGGLNHVTYLRWVVIPQLWGRIPLDLAWVRADVPLWAAVGGALLALITVWLGWGIWRSERRYAISAGLFCVVVMFGVVGLRLFHDRDPYFRSSDAALHELVDVVARETQRGDAVLLSNPAYVDFFMNYGKFGDDARIISLPDHPGDRPSQEQPPRVENENPELLVRKESIPVIHALAGTRESLWLVENFGPALPWSVRPVERFLASFYYPALQFELSAQARLIRFDTTPASSPFGFYIPQMLSDFTFGGKMRLLAWELPDGMSYQSGESIPLSLLWQGMGEPMADYTVGVYVRGMDGSPVAQTDSAPGWGFAPTSGWGDEHLIWDQRALVLPDDLSPGSYQLWLKVYGFDAQLLPTDLRVSGGEVIDGVIAVLAQIEVSG